MCSASSSLEGDGLADLDRAAACGDGPGSGARRRGRAGRSSRRVARWRRSTARSMALRSSRRLPGHAYREQGLAGLRRESLDLLAELPGEERQEVLGQREPVGSARGAAACVSSTTLRRKSRSSRNCPAATAASRSRLVAAISRTSAVRVPGLADPLVAPLLEESEQLGLERQRQVADLVEEQRARLRPRRPCPRCRVTAPVNDAAGVAEQRALQQLGAQARAAHGDERAPDPPAPGVDRPREAPPCRSRSRRGSGPRRRSSATWRPCSRTAADLGIVALHRDLGDLDGRSAPRRSASRFCSVR